MHPQPPNARARHLVTAVRHHSGLPDDAEAERALRATLRVLGERLGGDASRELAAQLPRGFCGILPRGGEGSSFGLDDFYDRVARYIRRDTAPEVARARARAVVSALAETVDHGVLTTVFERLPAEYADLRPARGGRRGPTVPGPRDPLRERLREVLRDR